MESDSGHLDVSGVNGSLGAAKVNPSARNGVVSTQAEATSKPDHSLKEPAGLSSCARLVKTVFMVGAGFAMGLPKTILGPTMLELKELLNTDIEHISWGGTAMSIGLVIGCLVGGVLCDKFRPHGDLLVFVGCGITGVCIGLVPWWPSLTAFYTLLAVSGFGQGHLGTSVFALTTHMWGEGSSTAIHVVFAGLTVGLLTSPLLATLILSEETAQFATAGNSTTIVSTEVEDPEQIRYVFVIAGAVTLTASLPFLGMHFVGPSYSPREETRVTIKETLSSSTYSPTRPRFGVIFVTIFFLIYGTAFAHATTINLFLFTISVDDYGVSKRISSGLLIGVFGMEVIGRLVFGFASKRVRIQSIIFLELSALCAFAVAFLTLAQTNEYCLWGLALTHQFFSGALYAGYVPWGDRYVEFTGVVTSVSQIAIAVGIGVSSTVCGPVYEHQGEGGLWYFLLACCAFLVVLTAPLQIVSAKLGERDFKEKNLSKHTENTKL